MTRMRTIDQTIAAIRSADPDTALTVTALRRMVRSGDVPSVRVGAKYLIDLDGLFERLANPAEADNKTSVIRPIDERRAWK